MPDIGDFAPHRGLDVGQASRPLDVGVSRGRPSGSTPMTFFSSIELILPPALDALDCGSRIGEGATQAFPLARATKANPMGKAARRLIMNISSSGFLFLVIAAH